jgi:hypothetical protein
MEGQCVELVSFVVLTVGQQTQKQLVQNVALQSVYAFFGRQSKCVGTGMQSESVHTKPPVCFEVQCLRFIKTYAEGL